MSKKHEVVIIGGGHNGLTVACYLAKAGVDVCVLEAQPFIGGGVITSDLAAPGFKTDICSVWHLLIQANPLITNDELGLISKFGLKYIYLAPRPESMVLFPDDSYLPIYKDIDQTCQAISKFSEHDADLYRKFHDMSLKSFTMMLQGTFNPAIPFGAFASMLDQSDEGRELLRTLMISADDMVTDWGFQDDHVKAAITRPATEILISPETKGTGALVLMMTPFMHTYGGGLPEGGSGALSEAMERCIKHYGGTILTNSLIESVIVKKGVAKSVIVKGGEEIVATKAIISNLNIKQLPVLVGEENLASDFIAKIKRLKFSEYKAINQGYALHEAPAYTAGDEVSKCPIVEFSPIPYKKSLLEFDGLRHGDLIFDMPLVVCQTLLDPTRAPEGKHTLYLYHYAPYDLSDGGPSKWDEIREEAADKVLETLQKQTKNMGKDNIIGRAIETPLDHSRRNLSSLEGDLTHFGMFFDQIMGNRPLPGWNYKTPIDKLWMCGPSCHPGLGVNGGGRGQVQPVMEALGIDFEKVISK